MARRVLLITMGSLAMQAGVARADGLPVLGIQSDRSAVSSANGHIRYLTHAGRRATEIRARSGRRTVASGRLAGRFGIPVVAYDGTPSGLAADGRTLVLIRPRSTFPQRSTRLAILDAATLRVRSFVHLHGDFSFDAISPSGTWIYLIQYTSPTDPTRYRVRALDTATRRLYPRDIVDPHERGEAMRGNPLTRTTSPDERWAYTLYDGNGHPFVHALDTAALSARCIDLPALPAAGGYPNDARLRLAPNHERLLVTVSGRTLAAIDTRALRVIPASRSVRRIAPSAAPSRDPGGALGTAGAIVGAFLLLAGATLLLRRRVLPLSRQADAR